MAIAIFSLRAILLFVFVILSQIAAVSMLPKTEGFRNVGWVLAALGTTAVSMFAMATIIRDGMPMSILIPLMAALMPLTLIAVGVVVYGEFASLLKIALLSSACLAVGIASALK